MSNGKYKPEQLRFFRLAICVVDHSSAALRKVFKREWNDLYPHIQWLDNRTSGSHLVDRETPSSRLNHPSYHADYKDMKMELEEGNADDWDVTALVFVLKFSEALSPIRKGSRWHKIKHAISKIQKVKNVLISHLPKACLSKNTFERNVDILIQAVQVLLSRSDRLVKKLRTLRNERVFVTDDLLRYKQMLKDYHNNLLLLENDFKKMEKKIQSQASATVGTRRPDTSHDNDTIFSLMHLPMVRLKRAIMDTRSVDRSPSLSIPAIYESDRYILLVNRSFFLSYNFQWKDLKKFLKKFDDDSDMQLFADIQLAASLSHQSMKGEALDLLDSLIPKVLQAKYRVVLHARIKIRKAYLLHDQGRDEEARKEVEDAETMLTSEFVEYPEDKGILHNIKANIILSSSKNAEADRERVIDHLNRCIDYCERATVDRSVTIVQATLRMALVYLGYYQHGILEDVPGADVRIAESILKHVSKSEPLSERSKVYYAYGQSLLAYRKGNKEKAAKLEEEVRGNCKQYKLWSEIQQLDILKTLILGGRRCKS